MNYQRIYDEIIERAKLRGLNKKLLNYYTEKHHIIPKCLNGSNEKDNLVLLTGREHYLSHYLLTKLFNFDSIWYSYHNMVYCKNELHNRYKVKLTSKQYEILRIRHSGDLKCKRTLETRQRISQGKLKSDYIMTDDVKTKISNSKKGSVPWNKGLKGRQIAWNKNLEFMSGGKNPKAVVCEIYGIKYSCKKDAMHDLNIENVHRLNKLLRRLNE